MLRLGEGGKKTEKKPKPQQQKHKIENRFCESDSRSLAASNGVEADGLTNASQTPKRINFAGTLGGQTQRNAKHDGQRNFGRSATNEGPGGRVNRRNSQSANCRGRDGRDLRRPDHGGQRKGQPGGHDLAQAHQRHPEPREVPTQHVLEGKKERSPESEELERRP